MADPYIPTQLPINGGGPTDLTWLAFWTDQAGLISALNAIVNAIPGVNVFTVSTQPALGPADAGYLGWLSDYQHQLRWTGATWQFFGDSNNGFFADFAIVPQSGLWQLCDGTTTKLLTLGATLTETSFTTPNLSGTPTYKKSGNAYSGSLVAASGTTGTDVTAGGTTGAGVTGTGTTGSANIGPTDFALQAGGVLGVAQAGASAFKTSVNFTVPGLSVPSLTVAGLSVPSLAIPALGVGSLDMPNLVVLPYVRR